MGTKEVLSLYDQHVRQSLTVADPAYLVERDGAVLRLLGPTNEIYDNCVFHSSLCEADADAAIERQIEYYGARKRDFEWKLYAHDTPADLGERLQSYGFASAGAEALVVLDLSVKRPPVVQPEGMTIRRLTLPEESADVAAVLSEVNGQDETAFVQAVFREQSQNPAGMSIYAAYADGRPVSAAWLRLRSANPFASLWGGSTLEAFRRRGIYKALVEVRAAEATRRGARYLTVDALPSSRPILERLGFQILTTTTPYIWRAPSP